MFFQRKKGYTLGEYKSLRVPSLLFPVNLCLDVNEMHSELFYDIEAHQQNYSELI